MKKKILITLLSIAVLLAVAYSLFKISGSRDFQFYGGLVTKVETQDKVVALTFDDGPTENTDKILSILKEEDIKATFFVTGREIEENFEEAKKLANAGHEL